MGDKLKNLRVQKLIQEYTFLLTDDEYKKEVVNTYQKDFLNMVNDMLLPSNEDIKKEEEPKNEQPKKEPKVKDDNLTENTKNKIKKIYRDIVKLTHPDKTNSNELIKLYIQAKDAYEDNDLFELYFISNKLNISLELDDDDTQTLNTLIDVKKKEVKMIESSFIWLWVHAVDKEEKDRLVTSFVEKHYKDRMKR